MDALQQKDFSRRRRFGLRRARSAALEFLEFLGLSHRAHLSEVVSVAEALFGRPIHVVVNNDPDIRSTTGWWVATNDFGLLFIRERDDEHYQLVSRLHELSHVFVSYAPPDALQSIFAQPVDRVPDPRLRICSMDDKEASFEARRLELFVEDVALELENLIRTQRSPVEANL